MSLPRHIFLLIFQLFCYGICIAQKEQIDSLKKILPYLKDSARVNCLNALSSAYLRNSDFLKLNNDTPKYYATEAYKEAFKIHYIYGSATALSFRGEVELMRNNFLSAEKLLREAIEYSVTKTNLDIVRCS